MKSKYLQITAAFLIGLLIPCLLLQINRHSTPSEPQDETLETTIPTEPFVMQKPQILVLDKQGNAVKMDLEEYLVGVVLAEMPTSYDLEALCAQTVVARTYALRRQDRQRHTDGAICMNPGCCQAYVSPENYLDGLGYQEDIDKTIEAIKKTEGVILTYEGEPIEATYFSCSGGQTEAAVEVWGGTYPYLQAVLSPGEEEMKNYKKEVHFTKAELENALDRELPADPNTWIGQITFTTGGGVNTIEIAGQAYTGVKLRSLLKLNSTAFSVTPEADGVSITTFGKGHRVGMSQSGAQAMALRGYGYQTILTYYYPGAVIDKLENMQ